MKNLFGCSDFDWKLISVFYAQTSTLGRIVHGHNTDSEIVYKLSGCSHQYIQEYELELVPDSIMFIPQGTSVHMADVHELGAVIIADFHIENSENYILTPSIINLLQSNNLRSRFFELMSVWNLGRKSYFKAQSVFADILSKIVDISNESYYPTDRRSLIKPAIDYISENCMSRKIRLTELAEICGISIEYLRLLFRHFTGYTPIEYINLQRLGNARELILSDRVSNITEAALNSGFENISYFSRLFVQKYGCRPSELINEVKFRKQ